MDGLYRLGYPKPRTPRPHRLQYWAERYQGDGSTAIALQHNPGQFIVAVNVLVHRHHPLPQILHQFHWRSSCGTHPPSLLAVCGFMEHI